MKSQKSPCVFRSFPLTVSLLVAAMATIAAPARAASIVKANNNNALDDTASWIGGVVPVAADVAVWNGNSTSTPIGTGISVAGVSFGSSMSANPSVLPLYNNVTGPFSFSAGNSTVTRTAHGLTNGQPVYLGTAPAGLANTVAYFVVGATADTFQLAATPGGSAINSNATTSNATLRGGGGSLNIGSSGLDFSTAPAARTATFASYTNLTANQTWTLGGTADTTQLTHTGIITGTGALTVGGSGLGILSLQAPNTFSGGLTLNSGGAIKIGGTVNGASSAIVSTAVGTGPLTINGGKIFGGSDTASATVNITSNFTVNVGSTNTNNGRLGLGGGINLGGAERTITLGRGNATASGAIANGSFRLTLTTNGPATSVSNGTLRFAPEQFALDNNQWVGVGFQGAANFPGNTGIILGNRTITTTGTSSHFGSGTNAPNLTVETGAIFNTSDGATATRTSQIASLNGGGTITNFDTDGAATNGNISLITLGNNNGSGTFTGRILNGTTANTALALNLSPAPHPDSLVSITKTGTGTQILSGVNNYTGNTTVSAGKLVTTTASAHGNGTYTVANSATLGVRVHQAGSSLGLNGLTLGASTLELDLSTLGNPTAPVIANAGNLALTGNVTVNILGSSGALGNGTFPLVSFTGRTGTGNFTLGSLPIGVSATLAESPTSLNLTITNVILSYEWTGSANSDWDTNGANTNWSFGGASSGYSDSPSRDVILSDTATGSTSITLAGSVTPLSVTATNSALAYTISGAGGIGGSGTLAKSGNGTLTLATANTFSGGTTVTSGTLNVTGGLADSGAITVNGGTATYTVGNDDTVGALTLTSGTINGSATLSPSSVSAVAGTISANLGGTATVTKTGASNVTLSGNSTYSGTTTVTTGNLVLAHNSALGSTAGGTVVTNNGTLVLNDGITVSGETITLTGNGNGARGLIRVNSGSATWAGPVIIDNQGADVRLGSSITAGGTLTFTGVISGGNTTGIGGNYTSTVTVRANSSSDTIVLAAANTFTGDFQINGGRVILSGGDNRLPVTARYVAEKFSNLTSTFDLNGNSQTFAGLVDGNTNTSSGSDTTVTNTSGTAATLTINTSIADHSFTGAITGNLAFVKGGSGTTTLGGSRSYTGNTSVNGGTLSLAQTGLSDAADVRLASGVVLALNYSGTDTVNALYVDGVLQPAGVYGSSTSGAANTSSLFSGDGTLTVTTGAVSDPYAAWADGFNFNGGDSTASGDPDNDGIKNLLEWVLAGDPTLSDSATTNASLVPDATYLNLVFERADSSESAVTLEARWGTNLSTWTNVTVGAASAAADVNGVIITVVENGSAPDSVTVSVPRANAVGGRLFVALRATKN